MEVVQMGGFVHAYGNKNSFKQQHHQPQREVRHIRPLPRVRNLGNGKGKALTRIKESSFTGKMKKDSVRKIGKKLNGESSH